MSLRLSTICGSMLNKAIFLLVLFIGFNSWSSPGLVIHAAEFGVGKFHRADNKVHEYNKASSWLPYILPNDVSTEKPLILKNLDGSYTVFFSTLEEMVSTIAKISNENKQLISVLNVHGHGMPGRMWFPKDTKTMNGISCYQWSEAASGSDKINYDQYYSPMSVDDVKQIRSIANNPNLAMPCTVGLKEWQMAVAANPGFKAAFAEDVQIHFLSCVVGLGVVGETFTQGIAELLVPSNKGHVETSINFGLGDWSLESGMGFWDYINEEQLRHDSSIYTKNRRDLEIAQKGTIRVATFSGSWKTALLGNRDFMSLGYEVINPNDLIPAPMYIEQSTEPVPQHIRLPGTSVYLDIIQN